MNEATSDITPNSSERVEPIVFRNPIDLILNEIDKRDGKAIILLGEDHRGEFDLKFPIELLPLIKEKGGKYVFLEEFETDPLRDSLEKYLETGEMIWELKEYLEAGGLRAGFDMRHPYKRMLIEKCKELQLTPIFIDNRDIRDNGADKDKYWEEIISEKIGGKIDAPILVIAGVLHMLHGAKAKTQNHDNLATYLDNRYGRDKILSILTITNNPEFTKIPFIESIMLDRAKNLLSNGNSIAVTTHSAEANSFIFPELGIAANSADIVVLGNGTNLQHKQVLS